MSAAFEDAIVFCQGNSFADLSNLTHNEEDQREDVREAAAYVVL